MHFVIEHIWGLFGTQLYFQSQPPDLLSHVDPFKKNVHQNTGCLKKIIAIQILIGFDRIMYR